MLRTLGGVRGSALRWRALSTLLLDLERGMEACARLDAHVPRVSRGGTDEQYERALDTFDARLDACERRVKAEVTRLTCERLAVDLAEKQERDAA